MNEESKREPYNYYVCSGHEASDWGERDENNDTLEGAISRAQKILTRRSHKEICIYKLIKRVQPVLEPVELNITDVS